MGVTVLAPMSATAAGLPSGVIAIAPGFAPTGIGGPARRVVRPMGVTVPPELTTNAVGCRAAAAVCGPAAGGANVSAGPGPAAPAPRVDALAPDGAAGADGPGLNTSLTGGA